jgi:hypothetical protein
VRVPGPGASAAPGGGFGGIPIAAPAPPTLSLGQAASILDAADAGDPSAGSYLAGTVVSANSGHPEGLANAEVFSVAQKLAVLARFVGQFVGVDQARLVATGLHLT